MSENAQEANPPASESNSGAVAVPGASKDITPARELVQRIASKAAVQAESGDRQELMMNALTDIANATSEADLFEANEGAGTPSLRDSLHLIGMPLNVYEVGFVQSSDEFAASGLGTFIVIHALTDKGIELEPFNTGAPNVVATLAKAQEMGLISPEKPWRIVLTSKATANGTLFKVSQPKV